MEVTRMAYAYSREKKNRAPVFYVGFKDASGKARRVRTAARNLTEARRMADQLERQAERERMGLAEEAVVPIRFEEAAARYLRAIRQHRSWQTIEGRFRLHILPRLSGMTLGQIRPCDLDEVLMAMAEAGYSEQTQVHALNHIRALYTWAIKRAEIYRGSNPAERAARPEIPERAPAVLEKRDIPIMLLACDPDIRGPAAFCTYTAARKGEMAQVTVGDVDAVNGFITIRGSYDRTTKTDRWRTVPIHPELWPYLQTAMAGKGPQDFLYPGRNGMRSRHSNMSKSIKSALRRAGLEHLAQRITWKSLRSTFATHAYEATGDIRFVQRVLGHTDPAITERVYAAMRDKRMAEQMGKLTMVAR